MFQKKTVFKIKMIKFKNLSEHSYYCFKKNIKRNKQSIFLQLNKNF